jgi:hypothetical protein
VLGRCSSLSDVARVELGAKEAALVAKYSRQTKRVSRRVAWEDLLQEALSRVLTGVRQRPEDVPMVAFVAGIMRSLRAEHWRRFSKGGNGESMLRLADELLAATDEEILATARELGMNPGMRGSAAFLELKYPIVRHPRDFLSGFDPGGFLPPSAPRIKGSGDKRPRRKKRIGN